MTSARQDTGSESHDLRLAELIGALSVATDLGMGHPLEFALCSCILAVCLGEASGFDDVKQREVYYQALLRYIGCNAETHVLAALIGDELALRRDFAAVNNGNQSEVMRLIMRFLRQVHAGESPLRLAGSLSQGLLAMSRVTKEAFAGNGATRVGVAFDVALATGLASEASPGANDGSACPQAATTSAIASRIRPDWYRRIRIEPPFQRLLLYDTERISRGKGHIPDNWIA